MLKKLGFKQTVMDNYMYAKFSGSRLIYIILYVDDVMLTSNDFEFLK